MIVKLALAVLGLALSGCASYSGTAVPIAESKVLVSDGWVRAAPTPTVLQRDLTDCGAAALAMIAGRWHVPMSLDDAARALPPPTKEGVRLADLRDAARAHGLVAFAVAGDWEVLAHELAAGRPVIVGLQRQISSRRALAHFEVVVALRKPDANTPEHEIEIATIDPGSGWQVRKWGGFEAEWKTAGHPALVVTGTRE